MAEGCRIHLGRESQGGFPAWVAPQEPTPLGLGSPRQSPAEPLQGAGAGPGREQVAGVSRSVCSPRHVNRGEEVSLTSRSLTVTFAQSVLPLTHQDKSSQDLSLLLQGAKYSSFRHDVCFTTAARGVTPGASYLALSSCVPGQESWDGRDRITLQQESSTPSATRRRADVGPVSGSLPRRLQAVRGLGLHSALSLCNAPDAPLTGFLLLRFQVLSHLSFIVPTGRVFSVHFCRMLFSGTRVLWCSRSACIYSLS